MAYLLIARLIGPVCGLSPYRPPNRTGVSMHHLRRFHVILLCAGQCVCQIIHLNQILALAYLHEACQLEVVRARRRGAPDKTHTLSVCCEQSTPDNNHPYVEYGRTRPAWSDFRFSIA